jgi:hypothetical protein
VINEMLLVGLEELDPVKLKLKIKTIKTNQNRFHIPEVRSLNCGSHFVTANVMQRKTHPLLGVPQVQMGHVSTDR